MYIFYPSSPFRSQVYSYFVLIFERKLDVMSNERAMSVLGLGKKKVGPRGIKMMEMMITKTHYY